MGNSSGQTIAIKAGKIVDPADGTLQLNKAILVDGIKIARICSFEEIPAEAKIVDCSGLTLMPGLVDAHTHLCIHFIPAYDQSGIDYLGPVLNDPPGYRALLGAANAKAMLFSGFTTVRDAGNSGNYLDVALKRAIQERLVPGPYIVPAGRIIAPFGGQFRSKSDKQYLLNEEYFIADTRDELKKAIRENIYYGSEVIKIVVDGQKYQYSTDDIAFVVQEAAAAGLKVMAHCQTERGAYNAALAGVASIEHGWTLADSTIALMKTKGIVLVSTDFSVHALLANGMNKDAAEKTHARFVQRLKRAYQAGLKIAFGTDVQATFEGMDRGQLALEYIDSFVEAGIPAAEILKICTSRGYELLGISAKRGSIQEGKVADIIGVADNPLDNIQTVKHVKFIMHDGVLYKQEQ
jgi:imidazolonepropionase-like amidohydrolase